MTSQDLEGGPRRRRRRARGWTALGVLALVAALVGLGLWLRGPTIGERTAERTIINVVLPPPPPPPPAPPPRGKPPGPGPPPGVAQPDPKPTPPPPTPQPQQAQSNDALTARQGAAAGNFGLAAGDGSGSRIGGKPGGEGFAAYAERVRAEIHRAASGERALQGKYRVEVRVWIDDDGRISRAEIADGSGDRRRDAALERLLVGLQLSQRPPPKLPSLRLEIARTGA